MVRLVASVALLTLFAAPAFAAPFVQTFDITVPSPMVPLTRASIGYELVISYVFTTEDLVNARIEIDLPPSLLLTDTSATTPFNANCRAQNDPAEDVNHHWHCSLTSPRVMVGTAISGTLMVRVAPAYYAFTDGQEVTVTARLTANDLTPVTATTTAVIDTTLPSPLVGDQVTLYDIATVENPNTGVIGIEQQIYRGPQNLGTGYVGRNVENRTRLPAGRDVYYLWADNVIGWIPQHTQWEQIDTLRMRMPWLFGPSWVYSASNAGSGERAEHDFGGSNHNPLLWTSCEDQLEANELTAEVWAPSPPGSSTYTRIDSGNIPVGKSPYYSFDCTTNADVDLQVNEAIVGSPLFIRSTIRLPMGAVPLHDAFIAFAIDPRLTYSEAYLSASPMENTTLAPFDLYTCNFPTGEVDLQRFLDDGSTACTFIGEGEATDLDTSNATHVIAYKHEFYMDEPYGRTVPRAVDFQLRSYVSCMTTGFITHGTRIQARRTPNGTIIGTGWDIQEREVQDQETFYVYGPYFNDPINTGSIISADRGEIVAISADPSGNQLGKNPHATWTLPAGVRFIDYEWVDYSATSGPEATCERPALDVDFVENPDGTTTVDAQLSAVGGGDWFYVYQCQSTDCYPAGNGSPVLYVQIDPTYPWTDGTLVDFKMGWSTDNGYDYVHEQQESLTINVPAQQHLAIEPTCSGVAGGGDCTSTEPDGRTSGLLVTMSNRGGDTLTDLTATIDVPKFGDGSNSETDTTVLNIVNPNGLDIDCWNGSAWTSTCNAASLRVRARAASVAPSVARSFSVFLDTGSGSTGAKIYGRGSLESNELAPVPAASVSPIRVNLCPGRLVASVYFDDNGNGIRDPGEPALSDWSIRLTDAQGSETYPIDFTGELDVSVARGAYTWTALRNGGWTQGVFSVGEIAGDDITICPDQTLELNVPVICTCDDGYACTTDSCNFLGQCSTVPYDGEVPQGDATCNGIDDDCDGEYDEDWVSTATTCTQGGCTAQGVTKCEFNYESSTCVFIIRSEICDGLDNDCDGWTDRMDGDFIVSEEVCDGLDNDCNGATDAQDWNLLLQPCYEQRGVCAGAIQSHDMCRSYLWMGNMYASWEGCDTPEYLLNSYYAFPDADGQATYVELYSDNDKCDGLDNDCDGQVDENFVSEPITCTNGACVSSGVTQCLEGELIEQCGNAAGGTTEVCDGVDNDCDGLVDASDPDMERPLCDDQDGVCNGSRKPLELCGGLAGWGDCLPRHYSAHAFPTYATSDLACDNLDNDCDGSVDEDFVGQLDLCAPGSCSPTARNRCVGGQPRTGCEPFHEGCAEDPGDLCEEACVVATELVVYGVAEDAQGVARGSFRCVKSQAGVVCDTDQNGVLSISDILWCGQ